MFCIFEHVEEKAFVFTLYLLNALRDFLDMNSVQLIGHFSLHCILHSEDVNQINPLCKSFNQETSLDPQSYSVFYEFNPACELVTSTHTGTVLLGMGTIGTRYPTYYIYLNKVFITDRSCDCPPILLLLGTSTLTLWTDSGVRIGTQTEGHLACVLG